MQQQHVKHDFVLLDIPRDIINITINKCQLRASTRCNFESRQIINPSATISGDSEQTQQMDDDYYGEGLFLSLHSFLYL